MSVSSVAATETSPSESKAAGYSGVVSMSTPSLPAAATKSIPFEAPYSIAFKSAWSEGAPPHELFETRAPWSAA